MERDIIVDDMERETYWVHATLDDRQADNQSVVVEIEGNIAKQSIYVLIYPESSNSYVTQKVVESCSLVKKKHDKSWLVQLTTGIKRKVSELVVKFSI